MSTAVLMKTFSSHSAAILILCFLPLFSFWNKQESRPVTDRHFDTLKTNAHFLEVGEDLIYEARWWFIKLGTIHIKVISERTESTGRYISCAAFIDSYSGLPFVNLHAIFQTILDDQCYSSSFTQWEQKETGWEILRYRYDRQHNRVFIDSGNAQKEISDELKNEKTDTISINTETQDGLSLLYFARANVRSEKPFTVPTMIRYSQGTTVLNFPGKETSVEIDAVEYPVNVLEFEGDAKFNGIFGFNGPFTGWFSNDAEQIPIKAKTSVIVGSITIELIQWTRNGWNPPKWPG
jgi:hypothetical protein